MIYTIIQEPYGQHDAQETKRAIFQPDDIEIFHRESKCIMKGQKKQPALHQSEESSTRREARRAEVSFREVINAAESMNPLSGFKSA